MKKGTLPKILIALILLITFGICMNLYIKKTQKIYLNLILDNKFDEAYIMYKKNSKILSKNLLAYDGFYFYFEKHDYVSALEYFKLLKTIFEDKTEDIFYKKIVIKLFEENHFDDAVFWHEQITGQNRDDFVLKFKEVAENFISTSETEKALKYYKILIDNKELDITLDDIYLKIINYFLDNSNFDSAVKFYKEAKNNNLLENTFLEEIYLTHAEQNLLNQNKETALLLLDKIKENFDNYKNNDVFLEKVGTLCLNNDMIDNGFFYFKKIKNKNENTLKNLNAYFEKILLVSIDNADFESFSKNIKLYKDTTSKKLPTSLQENLNKAKNKKVESLYALLNCYTTIKGYIVARRDYGDFPYKYEIVFTNGDHAFFKTTTKYTSQGYFSSKVNSTPYYEEVELQNGFRDTWPVYTEVSSFLIDELNKDLFEMYRF